MDRIISEPNVILACCFLQATRCPTKISAKIVSCESDTFHFVIILTHGTEQEINKSDASRPELQFQTKTLLSALMISCMNCNHIEINEHLLLYGKKEDAERFQERKGERQRERVRQREDKASFGCGKSSFVAGSKT